MNAGQIATSDGMVIPAPGTGRLKARAKRYRRQLACQRRGSRETTRARLAKTTRRIAIVRRDWHHRTSRALANAAGTIVIEDLQPVRMTRSAKGTAAKPRAERQRQGGAEPGDPGCRLGEPAPNAGIQGAPGDRRRSPAHQPDLYSVRARRRPIAQDTGPVSLRGMWPRRSRRPECRGEHPGLGDRGCCAWRRRGCPARETRKRSDAGGVMRTQFEISPHVSHSGRARFSGHGVASLGPSGRPIHAVPGLETVI